MFNYFFVVAVPKRKIHQIGSFSDQNFNFFFIEIFIIADLNTEILTVGDRFRKNYVVQKRFFEIKLQQKRENRFRVKKHENLN